MGVLLYSSIYSLCRVSFDKIASSGIDYNYPLSWLLINCVCYWDIITFERFLGVQRGWNFMCYLGLRLEKSMFFDEKKLEKTLFLGKNGLEF